MDSDIVIDEVIETVPENAGSGIIAHAEFFQGNTAYFQISLFLLAVVLILVIACLKSISRYKKEIAELKPNRNAKREAEEAARELSADIKDIKGSIWATNKNILELKNSGAKQEKEIIRVLEINEKDKRPYFRKEGDSYNFYIGINAGQRLKNAIGSAKKSVKILSPYISRVVIKRLHKKSADGLTDISIITSASDDDLKKYKQVEALKELVSRTKKEGGGYVYTAVFKSFFCKSNFMHAKLYIIDDETAFTGSMNFTKKGTKTSHETSLTIRDPDTVKKLSEYYDGLLSANLFKWNVAELGEKIYSIQWRKKTDEKNDRKTAASGGVF
jgi:phosphatidylserine/phosphatidylglycerophosphate/cardiolipin synthase-like enzyme